MLNNMTENMLSGKKAAFLSLGCKVNAYETEAVRQSFLSYGAETVDFKEVADIYVVNTCTVTNIADRKSRQMLRRARALNADAIVVATGCFVQEGAKNLEDDGCVNLLVGNRLKQKLAQFTNDYLIARSEGRSEGMQIIMNEDESSYEEQGMISSYKNARVDIKIQDGCNQFCSYCIIPYARGRISSRNPANVLAEIRGLAERGYKEVVLTGIHLSSYGLEDCGIREQAMLARDDGRMPLLELIEKIEEIYGIERIRFGSVEPRIITERFVEGLSKCKKFMPHFHLSLQSGCDTVLKRMNRKYDTAAYEKCCEIIRTYYYKPSITTDIITGFPGESEEEFAKTCEFVKKIGFAAVHIFPYSVREGTRAASMEGQLDNSVKTDRAKRLAAYEEILRENYETSFDGEYRPVLVEEIKEMDGTTYCIGHTPEYVKAAFAGSSDMINSTVEVSMSADRMGDAILAY